MKHSIYLRSMILLSVMALVICGCSSVTITTGGGSSSGGTSSGNSNTGSSSTGSSNTGSSTGATPHWGVQTKTSGCRANGKLPDLACTPGAIIASATKAQICVSGYSGSVRNVPTSEKNQVYQEYGIYSHTTGQYEVDHDISLELGGSNDIANLWPEPASPKPGFHEKDKVENYLHSQVCSGAMTLKEAQIEITTNWLAVYNRMPSK
jgi:hypothetical protein